MASRALQLAMDPDTVRVICTAYVAALIAATQGR